MKLPTRLLQHKDKNGHHWTVPSEKHVPQVDVWWNRAQAENIEHLVIKQDNGENANDVVMITPGQVYDLIDALNRAVENP